MRVLHRPVELTTQGWHWQFATNDSVSRTSLVLSKQLRINDCKQYTAAILALDQALVASSFSPSKLYLSKYLTRLSEQNGWAQDMED
jgi:hypothetical protein